MVTLFVHIVFGVCLALSITSKKEEPKIHDTRVIEDKYDDHIDPMFNQEDKDNGR